MLTKRLLPPWGSIFAFLHRKLCLPPSHRLLPYPHALKTFFPLVASDIQIMIFLGCMYCNLKHPVSYSPVFIDVTHPALAGSCTEKTDQVQKKGKTKEAIWEVETAEIPSSPPLQKSLSSQR